MAESEAASVEDLYQLAGSLPESERGRIQDLAASYTRVVVEEQPPGLRATHGSRAGAPERGIDASRRTGREPNAPPFQGSRWLSSHPVGGPGGGGCDHGRLHLPHRDGD